MLQIYFCFSFRTLRIFKKQIWSLTFVYHVLTKQTVVYLGDKDHGPENPPNTLPPPFPSPSPVLIIWKHFYRFYSLNYILFM